MAFNTNTIFRFSGSENLGEETVRMATDLGPTGDQILGHFRPRVHRSRIFNDIYCYERLRQEEGCVRVEIHSVRVRHTASYTSGIGNKYCHGIQVTYKQWFRDGTTRLFECDPNISSSGYYAYNNGRRVEDTVFDLQDGEYLTGLRVHQGEIVDGIIFVTNLREVHCVGAGGSLLNTMVSNPPHMRIVAFCGTYKGVWERVGYYAESLRWEIVGPFILLRELVRRDRVERPAVGDDLFHQIINLNEEGVFRTIMSYL